ncbi:hemin-degrading factor [Undibacterium danionis]|uniref:Hemin-degrading factor n=1 Tax=Undibacterium danionis TaxID=1812100 RepID=A0ABV6IEX5_9BURK
MIRKQIFVLMLSSMAVCSSFAADTLSARWDKLRQEQPKIQIRDAAKNLGVSEAELLATQAYAVRLQSGADAARKIMRRALDLGEVMALSRNENGVIEVTGVATRYTPKPQTEPISDEEKQRQQNAIGGYIGGPIDLRFHFAQWEHAFAVTQTKGGKTTRSLQFFDTSGDAIHKIYVKSDAGNALFDQLVEENRQAKQDVPLKVQVKAGKKPELADTAIDQKEFQLAWKEMTDVHQFSRLVTEFKLSREQALRLAPTGLAQAISAAGVRNFLDGAAKEKVAIMAFLGNVGITQIFSGQIQKTAASGDWYNVLDPKFNLHLRESAFARGWVVKRANITSVEFYDKAGELVVTFFGVRDRGQPQPQAWLDLVQGLPKAK